MHRLHIFGAVLGALLLPSVLAGQASPPTATPAAPAQQTQPQQPTPPANSEAQPQSPAKTQAKPRLTLDEILARLPKRVTSKNGKPGDMVNFLMIGSKEKMQAALKAADWVVVDRTPEDAVVHALSEVLAHQAYSEMPMSELYLFGRPQDFGYASGIPIQIVTERNHFRLWEAPWLTPDGQTVWVGAGTHDIGVEKDSTDQLTHAIDPDVDKEREYICQSLMDENTVAKMSYLTPADPIKQAFTATGDPFHSDGRVAVIFLK